MYDFDFECEDEEAIGKKNKRLGLRGELAAKHYLMLKDYDIVATNWECPAGEADIIAWDGDYLVFVEVKTRTSIEKGFPCEAVDKKKRKRYEKIACYFLKENAFVDIPIRFDVVDMLVIADDRAMIRHIVNAFGVA